MADERSMTDELKERLDIFFGEDDDDEEILDVAPEMEEEELSPLENLKSILLSLEWEITDEDLQKLLSEVDNLRNELTDDISIRFLQVLESIGKYIKAKKANAHPDTIRLLNSAFQNFALSVDTPDMGENEKKTLLIKTINNFKEVKNAISKEKQAKQTAPESKASEAEQPPPPPPEKKKEAPAPAPPEPEVGPEPTAEAEPEPVFDFDSSEPELETPSPPPPSAQPTPTDMGEMSPHEAFTVALKEIKETIEREFSALRAEIRMWRQGQ